jgi:RNA polymerase sigma-70 factor (ECF subfamily)
MVEAEQVFTTYRPQLFGLAYRMLGSVMDAEDVVQEAYLRWQGTHGATVEAPRAYLTTIVTRLCIDHLRSARVRREEYVGTWLPEPLVGAAPDESGGPAFSESLSLAFLVLLETLSPVERAVFLLHEVFGYSYAEIAPIVGTSEVNCRQIGMRARRHVEERRPRFDASPAQQERLLERFVTACTTGDLDTLIALLADDVTLYADGGGKVTAARRPIQGSANVARFLLGLAAMAPPTVAVRFAPVNGRPGVIAVVQGQVVNVVALAIAAGRVAALHMVANPDKLRWISLSEQGQAAPQFTPPTPEEEA